VNSMRILLLVTTGVTRNQKNIMILATICTQEKVPILKNNAIT